MFLLKLPRGNFRDIVHPDKLFTPQYLRYDILHFIIGFHVFVIIFCISINSMAYSPPLTPFSTINIISVNRSNFASFFLRLFVMLILLVHSSSYITRDIFRKFSNTLNSNYGIHVNFVFQNLSKSFLCVHVICISHMFHV